HAHLCSIPGTSHPHSFHSRTLAVHLDLHHPFDQSLLLLQAEWTPPPHTANKYSSLLPCLAGSCLGLTFSSFSSRVFVSSIPVTSRIILSNTAFVFPQAAYFTTSFP